MLRKPTAGARHADRSTSTAHGHRIARRAPARFAPALLSLALLAALLASGCQQPPGDPPGAAADEPHATLSVDVIVPGVDLIVTAVDNAGVVGDWQTLSIAGTASAEIGNQGSDAAAGPIAVAFFEDTDGDGLYSAGTDTLLGSTTHTGLGSGEAVLVTASLTGSVAFRDNLIHAFVDAGEAVVETNEDNNGNHSGQACVFVPPVGVFSPAVEWHWSSSSVEPDSRQVMMAPAVIDLNGDGIPDVVFSTFTGSNYRNNGRLRAISGADGGELWTVTDPAYDVAGESGVAVGDIDGDGLPEIIAGYESENHLIAFEHDGTFKWMSPPIEVSLGVQWGSAALADLDGDGTPEIVIGRTVLNNDGTLRWQGTGPGQGRNGAGPLSLVADVDLDGVPEVVAGNTIYRADGSVLAVAAIINDGFPAVANFDVDPHPEIVVVTNGFVALYRYDGTLVWGPHPIPGGGGGGPPTVADFDGDGQPEIGVAGSSAYSVFETDGTVKWSTPTQDASSSRTGSSVFDFDGDGSAEVVYGDEHFLRIYRGSDGTILFQAANPSGTTYELPVIVDVDADGNAEIVMISNNYAFAGSNGVRVFGDLADNWVGTRQIWNQHTYHVTNVNDDGTIPAVEVNNWQVPGLNNFRLNAQAANVFAAPDLTASHVEITISGATAHIVARIGNGGGASVPAGVPVSFYEGDPAAGGVLLGTVATSVALTPGQYEDVALDVAAETAASVWVVADDSGGLTGTVNECREDNNVHDSGLTVAFNQPPVCELAEASPSELWPPRHQLVRVSIQGVTDPDGDALDLTIDAVTSDEPTGSGSWWRQDDDRDDGHDNDRHDGGWNGDNWSFTGSRGGGERDDDGHPGRRRRAPDAFIRDDGTVKLRAERLGWGDGRVYVIHFTADDGRGGTCSGQVDVGVPQDRHHGPAVDSGQDYDATQVDGPPPRPHPGRDEDEHDDDRHDDHRDRHRRSR